MPSIEKAQNADKIEVEKEPSFAELQRQKEELFREIEEKNLELSEADKMYAVSLVGDYSVKDGFELAKRIGLNGNRTFFSLTNGDVVYKNKTFFKRFADFLEVNEDYVGNDGGKSNIYVLQDGVTRIRQKFEGGTYDSLTNDDLGRIQMHETQRRVQKIPDDVGLKIEDYYSHFIRNRRVKSLELLPSNLTKVEITAEDHLRSNEAMLEESYYTGPIRKALGIETESELEKKLSELSHKSFNWEPSSWIWRDNLITKSDLNIALLTFNKKLADVDLQKVLERARYAPSALLFNERKRGAEKGLVEQIKQSLIKRGFKEDEFEIKQNEKGEYEVMRKEDDETERVSEFIRGRKEKTQKKEGLTEIASIPHQAQKGTLDQVEIANGEIYKIYSILDAGRTSHTQVELPNGDEVDFGAVNESNRQVFEVGKEVAVFEATPAPDEKDKRWSWFINNEEVGGAGYDAVRASGIQQIEGFNYWVGVASTDTKNRLKSLREEEGNYAVIRDNIIERKFQNLTKPPRLEVIEGKICYAYEFKTGAQALCFGSETLGPFDDIKLCENSEDKLIFYAKKGDEHFVYVDGVEKKIPIDLKDECKVEKIMETIYGPVVFYSRKDKYYNEYHVNDNYDNYDNYISNYLTNITEIDGWSFYISDSSGDGTKYIHWKNAIGVQANFESERHEVVGFNHRAFITDGKRIISICKGPETDDPDLKELSFDGPVELVKSDGKLFIIESLTDKKRVWEYDEKGELKLNEKEQRDLDLANAVASEDLATIKEYFRKYIVKPARFWEEPVKSGIREMLEQSKSFVAAVNRTIREAPELFMDTLRAKDDKPNDYLMEQMFYYMFPEAQANKERAAREHRLQNRPDIFGVGGWGGGRGETVNYDPGVESLASVDESGYYEMMKADREVLRLREPLPPSTFIANGIFGNYTGSGWTRVNVPIDQDVQDPARETTFEFVDEKSSQTINLPRIAGAKIITERLKGVTAADKEVPVKIIEENSQGEVRVDKGKEAKHLTYSQSFSEAPKTMAEVTQKDYEKFKKDFERSFGDVMTKPIGDIGDDLDIFVRGLKEKSPREQVIAIQEFCYEYGYYNLDKVPRDTNSVEERLSIMEGRMDELKEKDPKLAHKLYAGICTDFATLTTALLRKAGFVSGISTGFVPEPDSTSVKTDRAHAVSYVLWPSSKAVGGKPEMIIVDGTPSNITPKIVEIEKKAQEIHKDLGVDAEKEMVQLEHILKTMDVKAIKNLDNGVLEKTLNNILYGVKQSHIDVMERVLNASRYAGFDILEMTRGNLEDQIEFRKFLEEEIYKEKSATHENRERRGEELFTTMLEFSRRFEKDKNVHGKSEALDVLDKVFDIADKYLDPIESRSAAAVVTYLRARRMR